MRAAERAHTSAAVSPGHLSGLLLRLCVAAIATLALLLVWRPTMLHAQPAQDSSAAKPAPEAAGRSHTVKAGETLWSLAARYYGDGHQWQALARRNNIPTTGEAPLLVGMRLAVPARPTVRGAKAAEVAAAPADSTVPKVALTKAGEGTLPVAASRAPAGSLAAQTSGKGNATGAGRGDATRPSTITAPATASAAAASAQDTAKADLKPQVGTVMGARTVRRIGLVQQDDQLNARKPTEVFTVFHRDLPDAAEAERRTRAVLRPNTPAPRQAEFDAAPWIVAEGMLTQTGRILARVGSPMSNGDAYPQRAIKTDQVEIEAAPRQSYKVGDLLVAVVSRTTFENGQRVLLPTGVIEVVKAEPGKPALAIVRRQSGRIEQGQMLVPALPDRGEWVTTQKLATPDVSTTVKWLDDQEALPTLQSFLVLAAGAAQGLKAGDEVALYRAAAKGTAEHVTAILRVVRVERDHAAAIITRQYDSDVAVGMIARRYAKAP